jgi:hypothetical protein
MASKIKVDQIEGSTGTSVTIPTGHTFTVTDGMSVAGGGTGLTSFTAGDVLYATGSTTLAKLPKGTAEQVLAMNSGATAPDWGSVDLTVLPTITVAKGGTNLSSFAAGDVLYATGSTTLAKLAKGSAAEVLTMNAGATAPEWAAAAAGGKVLQLVWATPVTANQDISTTTWTDVTGMTLDITPAATSSKIFVFAQTIVYFQEVSSDTGLSLRIDRDASVITSDVGGGYGVYSSTDGWRFQSSIMFYDAPSSTSALTYKIQAKTYSARDAELHESKDGYMYAYEIGA